MGCGSSTVCGSAATRRATVRVQRDRDLAIRSCRGGPSTALHSRRVLAVLRDAGVVHDHGQHAQLRRHPLRAGTDQQLRFAWRVGQKLLQRLVPRARLTKPKQQAEATSGRSASPLPAARAPRRSRGRRAGHACRRGHGLTRATTPMEAEARVGLLRWNFGACDEMIAPPTSTRGNADEDGTDHEQRVVSAGRADRKRRPRAPRRAAARGHPRGDPGQAPSLDGRPRDRLPPASNSAWRRGRTRASTSGARAGDVDLSSRRPRARSTTCRRW